jgi:hypothetical protein
MSALTSQRERRGQPVGSPPTGSVGIGVINIVPAGYSPFFVATATVAGALIGLLFVAISVRPAAAARTAHISTRLGALVALSAFLNTLFLSLLALLPATWFGQASIALAVIGLVAMALLVAQLVLQARERRPRALPRGLVLLVGQGVLYVLQLKDGLSLSAHPSTTAQIDSLATLVLVFFALSIARTWEFTGADNPSLLGTLVTAAGIRTTDATEEELDAAE